MADLIEAFPEFAPSTVMLIATIPGLFMIFPSLFYGKLSTKFTSRSLLFTGLILFMIGGIMPFFLDNLFLIILFRGVLGLGVGITLPLSIDIITRFYEDRERDFLIGFGTSTIACIGAIFFQLGGGMLADSFGWQYGFLVYIFPIWILAITFLYLPEPKKKHTVQASLKETLFSAPKTVYGFTIGQVFFSMLVFGYVTNISILIQEEGLGSATEAGLAISLFTFGTLIIGMFFSKLRAFMPTQNVPIAVLLTGVGIFVCYLSSSLAMIFVGSIIGGVGLGLALPGVLARTSELSNEKKGISFVGFIVAAQGLGGLLSPLFYQTILNITGFEGGRTTLLFASLGLTGLAIVWSIILIMSNSKSHAKDPHAPAL